jgi:hypothetical protein
MENKSVQSTQADTYPYSPTRLHFDALKQARSHSKLRPQSLHAQANKHRISVDSGQATKTKTQRRNLTRSLEPGGLVEVTRLVFDEV